MTNNQRQQWYRTMASVFLTLLATNSLLLAPLTAFNMVVEACACLGMMVVNGGLFVHACWRLNQLKGIVSNE